MLFCKNEHGIHVQIYSDNSPTVNYINAMGGTHSREYNSIAKDIWQWCIDKQAWLTAAYIPGTKNVEADRESRLFADNKEWMIRPDIFRKIADIWGEPSTDLFATRINHQVSCYVSWKPDPGATFIASFSITWDKQLSVCAFPPFSLITRCLQKIQTDSAEGFMIVPMWPTQSWYPKLLHMLVDVPRILPSHQTSLQTPGMKQGFHPLAKKLVLIVCRLSGSPTRYRDFLKRQPLLSYNLGGKTHTSSYIKRWTIRQKQIDPVSATVPEALDFLMEIYETGVGCSGLNTSRSALSTVLKTGNELTFGAQQSVKRFLKGVYEARPSNPRYAVTWEVNKVLNYLKSTTTTKCSLEDLTLKLVTLMSLLSAQRGQTVHCLSLEYTACLWSTRFNSVSETSVTFLNL